MSTEREIDPERSPLLRSRSRSHTSKADSDIRSSILWRLAPSITACALATAIVTTTLLEVVKKLSCRVWYLVNDPDALPSDGSLPDDMCRTGRRNSPEAYFTNSLTMFALAGGVAHFLSSSAVAKLANTWGRKKMYVSLATIDAISSFLVVISINGTTLFSGIILIGGFLVGLFGGYEMALLPATMMIVDTTNPSTRSSSLSRLRGAAFAGAAPGFVLGGYITTQFSPMITLWTCATIASLNLLYSVFFIPETLSAPEICEVELEEEEDETRRQPANMLKRIARSIGMVFAPLWHLRPTKDELTGRWNPRLLLFAVGLFCYTLGAQYLPQVIILYGSNNLGFDAQDIGWILGILQSGKVFFLLVVLPPILHFGRRYYNARGPFIINVDDEEESEDEATQVASHFDVHLVIGSWILEGIVLIGCALCGTKLEYMLAIGTLAFSSGWQAGFDSATVASVHRLDTASVLAAMSMIKSISDVLSPIVMGNIVTASLGTLPNLTFFVVAGLMAVGSVTILFVKDSDRYTGR